MGGPGVSVSRDQRPGDAAAPVPTTEALPLGLAGSCLPPLRHPTADNPLLLTGALSVSIASYIRANRLCGERGCQAFWPNSACYHDEM